MMRHSRKRQQGSALLIVMLVMAMMGLIGFAALEAVTRDQRVAGFMKRKKIAFFAAEAGVSAALHALRTTEEPDFTASTVGDASWFTHKGFRPIQWIRVLGRRRPISEMPALPGMNHEHPRAEQLAEVHDSLLGSQGEGRGRSEEPFRGSHSRAERSTSN